MNAKHMSFIQAQAFEAIKLFKSDRPTALEKVRAMLERDYDLWVKVFKETGYHNGVRMFWAEVYKGTELPE